MAGPQSVAIVVGVNRRGRLSRYSGDSLPVDRKRGSDGGTARLLVATVFDVALLGLAVVVLIAFVQYGRIYNARIPTE